jgi:hypothetical protein
MHKTSHIPSSKVDHIAFLPLLHLSSICSARLFLLQDFKAYTQLRSDRLLPYQDELGPVMSMSSHSPWTGWILHLI